MNSGDNPSDKLEWERSRTRWRKAPAKWQHLTWGEELTGDAFIDKASKYAEFSADKQVLEIGPGYGRLLKSCLERDLPFARYCGVDLSEETCVYLREQFPLDNAEFVTGDVESASFDTTFDIVLSSLTLKHLFPTCETALENVARSVSPGAVFCIDFMESEEPMKIWEEQDQSTFVRRYTRPELLEILERAGLEHVAFDEVRHLPDPRWWRLLVVARKPG